MKEDALVFRELCGVVHARPPCPSIATSGEYIRWMSASDLLRARQAWTAVVIASKLHLTNSRVNMSGCRKSLSHQNTASHALPQ